METAKVDVRKLQLLNDRINQTLEALHQVRLSIHSLQYVPEYGAGGFGIGPVLNPSMQMPWGVNPYASMMGAPFFGYAQQPQQTWGVSPWIRPFGSTINGHETDASQGRYGEPRFNDVRFTQPGTFGFSPIPAVG